MRVVLLAMAGILFTVHCSAQTQRAGFIMWPTDARTEKIVFSESVYMPDASLTTLYSNAKRFVASTFQGKNDIVIANDSTNTISCKSAFFIPVEELGERGKGYISYTFTIWCHNNAYRYSLTDLEHFPLNPGGAAGGPLENERAVSGGASFPMKFWTEEKGKCYFLIQDILEGLKQAMNKGLES